MLESYVMLPIIMCILSLLIAFPIGKAFKASLTLGIGFIGIFIIFNHFISYIGPALEKIIQRTGLSQNVLDIGWPPLAATAWSFKFATILVVLLLLTNGVMLVFKWTQTVNIDIWNYWHFIFTSQMVYEIKGNLFLALVAGVLSSIICLKLADWSAEKVKDFSEMEGISITTLSAISYYPFGIIGDKIIDRIPYVRNIKADPVSIQEKLGILGEPMILGLIMGMGVGIAAGYPASEVLTLAFNIAAVVYLLPKMAGILGEGLMPISSAMQGFIKRKFPQVQNTYIGLDLAVIVGNPAAVVTGILMMPIALLLAFLLPGVRFIPLGDLPNIMGAMVLVVLAVRGNVIRAIIIGIPIIAGKLYAASFMASTYTSMIQKTSIEIQGYNGIITSFLDGGNLLRVWLVQLFSGEIWAFVCIPFVALLFYFTKKESCYKNSSIS
ncbi:MAG: PTS galactitol transporter subunit IIC [Epulopiscium sp.]|nr:PTS galactitol transporter subunit IIC [Candidatus Epulonipiscium sp.]